MKRIFFLPLLISVIFTLSVFSGCTDEPDNIMPTAMFTIEPTSAIVDQVVYVNSSSTDPDGSLVNYTWSIDGGIIAYSQNITTSFSENGTYRIRLKVVDNKNGSDYFEKYFFVGDTTFLEEKLLGLWEWSTVNQTGNWTFYQNHTLESTFTGHGGASVTDWWSWTFNHSQLCFYDPKDEFWDEGCYDFEFMDDYQTLKVSYEGNIAIWHKVQDQ